MKRLIAGLLIAAPLLLASQVLNKPRLAVRNWATGLSVPVALANCGDDRLFVIEKAGVIKIISDSMVVDARPFLNISSEVNSAGNEQGMLGLAFEPDYLDSGYFYVYYIHGVGSGTSRISRFRVSSDPDSADVASEQVIYTWPQPYENHNGGDIHFGLDGYLYCGFGDGGSGNDPLGNGQNYTEPLGGMIRIDVSQHNNTYAIPADNPFAYEDGTDTLPEVWAVGLRNPWRWSFDRLTGDVWIGDVGQYDYEEVDFWPAGDNSCPNFGWRCREGFHPNPSLSQTGCQPASYYVEPLAETDHNTQGVCSIIGGYVYRGSWYPHHYGHYIFTDYCTNDFLTFAQGSTSDVDTMLLASGAGFAAFGEDAAGQIYVANQQNGQVKKIYDPCPMDDPMITSNADLLTATAGNSYQWFLDGQPISGATSQDYLAAISGDYQVQVNFGSPCTLISDTLEFVVSGLSELHTQGLVVFPQPAHGMVTIERAAIGSAALVVISDALGRELVKASLAQGQRRTTLDVSSFTVGLYTVSIVDDHGKAKAPLLIVH